MWTSLIVALSLVTAGRARDIRSLLEAQGFEWTLRKADAKIEHVGDIREGHETYSIYLYNGINRADGHGINLFVVLSSKAKYLGVYDSLSAHDCRVRSNTVACKTDYPGSLIKFTKDGPPSEIWIDGANNRFSPAGRSSLSGK